MTKRKPRIIWVLILLVLAAVWGVYAFPRTPERLAPGLDLSACKRLTLEATWYPDERASHQIRFSLVLSPEDEGFDAILNSLRTQKFSRAPLGGLTRNSTKAHRNAAGDIRWVIHCFCGDSSFRLNNFFGQMSMNAEPGDRYAKLRTRDSEAWRSSIYDLISQNPNAEITKE